MRGTAFVVFEVLVWMILAMLIGAVIGWLIRGWLNEEKLRARLESESEPEPLGDGESGEDASDAAVKEKTADEGSPS